MKLLADMHIAPRTVQHLRQIGHDVLRVDDILPPTATDTLIIATAKETALQAGSMVTIEDHAIRIRSLPIG